MKHKLQILAVFFAATTVAAFGQSTAALSGTVTDPTGAAVPNAHVVVHSLGTGADRNVDTDASGLYAVPSLEPGDYSVRASATGFANDTVPKVTLNVASSVTLNLKLAIASTGETVQVEGEAQNQIETQTITVGEVIDNRQVQDLPLNGRHFLDLTVLTPGGVVAPTNGSLTATSRGLGANSFITGGNREDSVNFQINGINLNDISQNQITFQPSIATTSEFRIINQTFSAEYGRSDGSIVTVATKSGTNQFHGEAFDYFRNEALDARNYFNRNYNPATLVPLPFGTGAKAPLKRNNFGGDLGGPIFRNHTFFYFSYEGLRQHQGILQNSNVFTSAQRAAFIPGTVGAKIAALIPQPNSGSTYVSFTPGPVQIDQYTGDVLQKIGDYDTLHGFYAFQKDVRTEPALQGDTLPGWGDHRAAHRQIGTLQYVHIFSPKITNEARLGFNRISISFNPANTIDPTSVGLGDGLSGPVGLPQITITDDSFTFGGPSGFPQGRDTTTGVLADTVTMLKGNHQINWGGEFRRYLLYSFTGNIGSMSLTSANLAGVGYNGVAVTPVFAIQPNIIDYRVYADAAGAFVQDHYNVTPQLMFEYGLRFEWNGTPVEGENRISIFQPATSTLVQAGTNGIPADGAYKQNYNLEPRLGFSYDVFHNQKTVVRGAYGLLVDQPVAGTVTVLTANPPFTTAVSYNNSANPQPLSNIYAAAAGASGFALGYVNPHFRNAYVEDFNLNIQQALPWAMVGTIGYYGSTGHHLLINTNFNQASGPPSSPSPRPYTTLASTSPIARGASIASNINERNSIGYSNYNSMWVTLNKSFAHGFQFNTNYEWAKSMDINSLGSQGTLTANGGLEDANNPALNYGLSDFDVRNHFAGTAIYALPFKRNRFVEGFRLEGIFQYQTGNPVNILASTDGYNGIAGNIRPNLLGKFGRSRVQVPGQSYIQYFNVPGGQTYGGSICDLTNYTPACLLQVVGTQPSATGPLAATQTTYPGLGNIQRNYGTGPGFADWDMSGEKETRITERVAFTLRADAFDILNHPNFGQPTGNVQSAAFGQITATRFATSDGGSSRQLQISGKFTF
ncbi:MAG TPA: carboxypeptidase regulatory-like domain-containing protein [Acidobacteriaceae bacterium]|nr:carboxypeptidase regulatory-like domain-containing protein [Acidobacteriaceae bacterium]